MKYFFIYPLVILMSLTQFCYSQSFNWEPSTREIVIQHSDSVVRAYILINQKQVNVKSDLRYFWHKRGIIKSNIGGYSGELLHGEYTAFDDNGNLLAKGQFKNGLKVGVWRKWDINNLLVSAEYDNGKLHGKLIKYAADGTSEIFNYKHGVLCEVSERESPFEKIKTIFSKKDSLSTNSKEKPIKNKSEQVHETP